MSVRDELAEQWRASSLWNFDDWLVVEVERLRAELAAEVQLTSDLEERNNRLRTELAAAKAEPPRPASSLSRDDLGRIVREAWVKWARQLPTARPSWLMPYDKLSDSDKEADRQIGEAVVAAIACPKSP